MKGGEQEVLLGVRVWHWSPLWRTRPQRENWESWAAAGGARKSAPEGGAGKGGRGSGSGAGAAGGGRAGGGGAGRPISSSEPDWGDKAAARRLLASGIFQRSPSSPQVIVFVRVRAPQGLLEWAGRARSPQRPPQESGFRPPPVRPSARFPGGVPGLGPGPAGGAGASWPSGS